MTGLGWMLTRSVWEGLRIQWNAIEYWDEFMRKPEVRQNRYLKSTYTRIYWTIDML